MKENLIVSLSGGKDSTAMLLMLLEKGIDIHSAVFFDTGWEFPQMLEHIDKLEKHTDIPIFRVSPTHSFDSLLYLKPIVSRKGDNNGSIHRKGNGWPSPFRRWCTRQKINSVHKYIKSISNSITCIGFASDEHKRVKDAYTKNDPTKRYPLVEWGVTEKDALKYCYDRGFTWGGLYEHFDRVSCFCCPLQSKRDLRMLRSYYPELWERMLVMDNSIVNNRGFRGYDTVKDIEAIFAMEDKHRLYVGNR